MDTQTRFEMASKAYKEWWPKTCYTNILMLDLLVKLSGQSWGDFIKNPAFDDKEGLQQKILMLEEEELKHLWKEGHGLCTSWCIYIAELLEEIENFGDQGHHRAAFYNDGVVIDSSARDALLCRPGKSERKGKVTWWMEDIGQIKAKLFSVRRFNAYLHINELLIPEKKTGNHEAKEFKKLDTWKQAVQNCLIQLASSQGVNALCLYRFV